MRLAGIQCWHSVRCSLCLRACTGEVQGLHHPYSMHRLYTLTAPCRVWQPGQRWQRSAASALLLQHLRPVTAGGGGAGGNGGAPGLEKEEEAGEAPSYLEALALQTGQRGGAEQQPRGDPFRWAPASPWVLLALNEWAPPPSCYLFCRTNRQHAHPPWLHSQALSAWRPRSQTQALTAPISRSACLAAWPLASPPCRARCRTPRCRCRPRRTPPCPACWWTYRWMCCCAC